MKKANENFIPLDFSSIDELYRQLVDAFEVNLFKKIYFSKIFFLANQSTSILLGERFQSTFSIMERFSSTFKKVTRLD